jgi:hypothetical protein
MFHDSHCELDKVIADKTHFIFHTLDQTINKKRVTVNPLIILLRFWCLEIAYEENHLKKI